MKHSLTLFLFFCWFNLGATNYTLVASGTWGTTTIWSPNGVPGSGDNVTINDPGMSTLTVTLSGDVTIDALLYDGHYLRNFINGTGKLTLGSNSIWKGGALSGSVEIVVPSGVVFALDADEDSGNRKVMESNAKVTNNGEMTWGGNGIFFYNNALIDNNNLFTNNTPANRLYSESLSSVLAFINDGTFTCSASVQDFSPSIHFQNNGTLNINGGFMQFVNRIHNTGTINLNANGTANHKLTNYTNASPGKIHFGVNNAKLEFDDTSTVGPVTIVEGYSGTIAFVDKPSSDGSTITINQTIPPTIALDFSEAKTVTLNVDYSLASNTTFPTNMILNGTGKLTILTGKEINWNGGKVEGSVELIVLSGGKITLATGNNKQINNTAKLTVEAGGVVDYSESGGLVLDNTAQLNNAGNINIQGDFTIFDISTGTTTLSNTGTIKKTAGTGTAQIQPAMTNSGIVSVENGTINFFRTLTINSGSTLKGNGTMSFANSQNLGGTIAPGLSIGTLTLSGSSLTLSGTVNLEVNGSSVDVLHISGDYTIAGGTTLNITEISPLTEGSYFSIITSSGSRTGTFTTVNSPSGSYSLDYTAGGARVLRGVLPVELTVFTGFITGTFNALHWETASENNSESFSIERSKDGRQWESIGELPAAGTSLSHRVYQFTDVLPLPVSYYRLRMVDLDGSFEFSKTIILERSGNHISLNTYPNPVNKSLRVDVYSPAEQDAMLVIADQFGRIVQGEKIHTEEGTNSHEINVEDLPAGVYYIEIKTEQDLTIQKIVKQ